MGESSSPKKSDYFKSFRDWFQIAIITFAALWGAYEFIVKDIIRPAQKPTSLSIAATLEKVGEERDKLLIRVNINATNPTDKRIYVPAFWYTVTGVRLSNKENENRNYKDIYKLEGGYLLTTHYPAVSGEVLAQQRITYNGTAWWEPKDITNNESVFAIPANDFDYLELRIMYLHTKDIDNLNPPDWVVYNNGTWDASFNVKKGNMEIWQEETGSGYNWYITTLPLW